MKPSPGVLILAVNDSVVGWNLGAGTAVTAALDAAQPAAQALQDSSLAQSQLYAKEVACWWFAC